MNCTSWIIFSRVVSSAVRFLVDFCAPPKRVPTERCLRWMYRKKAHHLKWTGIYHPVPYQGRWNAAVATVNTNSKLRRLTASSVVVVLELEDDDSRRKKVNGKTATWAPQQPSTERTNERTVQMIRWMNMAIKGASLGTRNGTTLLAFRTDGRWTEEDHLWSKQFIEFSGF